MSHTFPVLARIKPIAPSMMEYDEGIALVYVPSNETSSAIDYDFIRETVCVARTHYFARMTIFAFFVLFGVIGNIALLFVILKDKHLRNAPNILISNLAVADLVYILVMGPIRIEHEIHPCWLKGELACAFRYYAPVVCQCTCVYSLVALSRREIFCYNSRKYIPESRIKLRLLSAGPY